ncbi:MAG TPA: hydroxymethylglutaryl-CoA reductase, degradative [Candidatus Bilamarchaeum sp.]|nr:hydroxymethylglutaryl-CoA reductase, degradative [Candidatus Bilamarchaeum sp.]
MNDIFSGFYKLTSDERLERVKKHAQLTDEEAALLKNSGALAMDRADKMVENVIGAVHLPMGLATNFRINGRELVIPMALEESSVIAAASKAAKQSLPEGFKAEADEPIMIGQIQLTEIEDVNAAMKNLELNRKEILGIAQGFMKNHEKYGCGVRGFHSRLIETERGHMVIVDFQVNVGDAQGANMVNTLLENISPTISQLGGGKARLRIVSNLATLRKARASAVWKKDLIGPDAVEGILDAYEFAKHDVYRCATHNKGIMNGIDAVAMACGNDWRSVEAGAHAYAALGHYKPLTHYYKNENGDLVGSIELPLAVAAVGPAISGSPTAKIALKIMGVKSSRELAMAMASVGLANNVAALAALSTVGIQQGHMKLHGRNIAVYAGATSDEAEKVADELSKEKNFSVERAKEVLADLRKSRSP